MTSDERRPGSARSPLRNPSFALLWSAGLISDLGDWMLLVALPVYVFQLTGSALVTSTVFVVELVPALFVGQLAGVLVDRWDRRRILVASGLLQAALLLPLLAADSIDRIWIVYVVAAGQSCLARLAAPAKAALVPAVVQAEELTAANALGAVSDNVARLVGSPLGGLAIGLFGLVGVVVVDAATFVASSLLVLGVRARRQDPTTSAPAADRASVVGEWLDGLRTIRRTPPLLAVLSIGALSQVAQGIFVVLFVVFVLRELGGTGGDVGLIRGVQAIGGIAGGLAIGFVSRRASSRALIGWGFICFGLISLVTWNAPSLTTWIGLYVGLFVVVGLPGVATMTGLMTTVQSVAPATHLGRVFATFETGAGALQAVGVLIAGALADRVGVVTILNAQASIYILCGVLAFAVLRARTNPAAEPDAAGLRGGGDPVGQLASEGGQRH
jgi:MFS family permease